MMEKGYIMPCGIVIVCSLYVSHVQQRQVHLPLPFMSKSK